LTTDENMSAAARDDQWQDLAARVSKLESTSTPQPWWRDKVTMTILGAMVAAVAPVTTAIDGCQTSHSELSMAAQQQQHQIRLTYLDRATSSDRGPAEKEAVLRFLSTALAGDPLQDWASAELKLVSESIAELEEQLASVSEELGASDDAIASLLEAYTESEAGRLQTEHQLRQEKRQRDDLLKELQSIESELDSGERLVPRPSISDRQALFEYCDWGTVQSGDISGVEPCKLSLIDERISLSRIRSQLDSHAKSPISTWAAVLSGVEYECRCQLLAY